MGLCQAYLETKEIVEVKTWEREGHPPDTSQPPDTHTISEEDFPDALTVDTSHWCDHGAEIDSQCPLGTIKVVLDQTPAQDTQTSVVWKHWYTVEPEIPHLKTYYAKERKKTQYWKGIKQTFVCLNPKYLKDLAKHIPA